MNRFGAGPLADQLGVKVVVSNVLPILPTPRQDATRIVRHGLADWVAYIGEQVGPKPGEPIHALMIGGTMHASRAFYGRIQAAAS